MANQEQSILKNIYLHYTERDLDAEYSFLMNKLAHPAFSSDVKKTTSEQLAQYYQAETLFEDFNRHIAQNNFRKDGQLFSTDGMTLAQLFELFTGRTIGELQSSIGTTLSLQVDKALDKTIDYTKKGAAWAGTKLLQFSEQNKNK